MKMFTIQNFHSLSFVAIMMVYSLIFSGTVVRTSRAGMGCPDWPTCFGRIIPPTSINQLPSNYQERYTKRRLEKNERFAQWLSRLGFSQLAHALLHDPKVARETEFNVTKAWTEYVNRLISVFFGLVMMGLFVISLFVYASRPDLFWYSLGLVGLTLFQGWFGSVVVLTHLTMWTVSVHLVLALLILALVIYLYMCTIENHQKKSLTRSTKFLVLFGIVVLATQVIFGIRIRQVVDVATSTLRNSTWVDFNFMAFFIHRSFSWAVLLVVFLISWVYKRQKAYSNIFWWILSLTLLLMLSGMMVANMNGSPVFQSVHLVLASVVLGLFLKLYWSSRWNKQKEVL